MGFVSFQTTVRFPLEKAIKYAAIETLPVVTMEQVHGSVCHIVSQPFSQCVLQADACLTSQPGLVLQIKHADCLPVLLYHPSGVVGAIHAGRKGTEQHIFQHTLQMLKNFYEVQDGLRVWFGPAICEKCYQINREPDEHYSLIEKNKEQLLAEFESESVELTISPDCTCHQSNTYHSYRRKGPGVQMNYSGIVLS